MVVFRFPQQILSRPLPENLSAAAEGGWVEVRLAAGSSIRETLERAGITLNSPAAAVVNGRASDLDRVLENEDCVEMLPQIAGG